MSLQGPGDTCEGRWEGFVGEPGPSLHAKTALVGDGSG